MLNVGWELGGGEICLLKVVPPVFSDAHSRLRIHSSCRIVFGGIHQPYQHSLSSFLNGKCKIAVVSDDYGCVDFTRQNVDEKVRGDPFSSRRATDAMKTESGCGIPFKF